MKLPPTWPRRFASIPPHVAAGLRRLGAVALILVAIYASVSLVIGGSARPRPADSVISVAKPVKPGTVVADLDSGLLAQAAVQPAVTVAPVPTNGIAQRCPGTGIEERSEILRRKWASWAKLHDDGSDDMPRPTQTNRRRLLESTVPADRDSAGELKLPIAALGSSEAAAQAAADAASRHDGEDAAAAAAIPERCHVKLRANIVGSYLTGKAGSDVMTDTAAACCEACIQREGCNVWVWCIKDPLSTGCRGTAKESNETIVAEASGTLKAQGIVVFPPGLCTLKSATNPRQPELYPYPTTKGWRQVKQPGGGALMVPWRLPYTSGSIY